jgi:superfamily II DNA or RNA helicase
MLAATTAFGNTVVAATLITGRAKTTLILVRRRELLDQWAERLRPLLQIDPKLTSVVSGRKRKPPMVTMTISVFRSVRGNVFSS